MYIPQIYQVKDDIGNYHNVEVVKDYDTNTYVAAVRGGRYLLMASGNKRQAVLATGEADKPHSAAYAAMKEYNNRR